MNMKKIAGAVWKAFCQASNQPKGIFGTLGGVVRLGDQAGGQMPPEFPIESVAMKPYQIAAAVTLTDKQHSGRTGYFDVAAGAVVTLPRAVGSGALFRFFCKTTITSNAMKIQVANADDVMQGNAIVAQDGGDTLVMFEAGSTADTLSGNGTTTGGIRGDFIEIEDVATGLFRVHAILSATSTEATPFSAAVS